MNPTKTINNISSSEFNTEEDNNTKVKQSKKNKPIVTNLDRTIEWLGGVSYMNLDKTFASIKMLMMESTEEEITLVVNSYGGVTGIGMSFYDAVNTWLNPNLTTIGSGDVDSSGVIIFLSGKKRYLTKNTTLLLHLAGRTFEGGKRFSSLDLENALKEDRLKDYQYACVVADATNGRYTPERILGLMAENTLLTAEEAVNMGLADRVLQ
jgi:ATP-dependent Clp protease, protease subunit